MPFQLVFLFLVWVFHGIDVGGRVLSNLETKYFDTKHLMRVEDQKQEYQLEGLKISRETGFNYL